MKVKYDIDDSVLLKHMNEQYSLHFKSLVFIPMGDSAYSYEAACEDGKSFYLKLFDCNNDRQRQGIRRLDYYLPLTWTMHHEGIFKNVSYPIQTRDGSFYTKTNNLTLVLFQFIHGDTLANAYPFSKEIIRQIADSLACIHQIPKTKLIGVTVQTEDFDISFLPDLVESLSTLRNLSDNNRYKKQLRELVSPKQEEIRIHTELLKKLHSKVKAGNKETVLCHGDVWGGNLILDSEDRLHFLDWENAILAPPERDLFTYIGQEFETFISHYQHRIGDPVTLNYDLLNFYFYRHHLRNLTNWMLNILGRNTDDRQSENDLDMIENHCLNRWVNLGG